MSSVVDIVKDLFYDTFAPDWLKKHVEKSKPLTDQQRWGLASAAQLTEINGHSHSTLHPKPASSREEWGMALGAWWKVFDRNELLVVLQELQNNGEATNPELGLKSAWDLARLINVARWGYGKGYLTYQETLNYIEEAIPVLKQQYHSWAELAQDYQAGYLNWAGEPDKKLDAVTAWLLDKNNAKSIWNQIPFN